MIDMSPGELKHEIKADPNDPSRRGDLWRHLKKSKAGITGFVITFGFILVALTGPYLWFLDDPADQDLASRLEPPVGWGGTWDHPLGTDQLGRDLLARLVAGARVSLLVGVSAVVLAAIAGTIAGLIAGYRGGIVDTAIMSIADLQAAFPGLLVGLVLVSAFGPSVGLIVIVIAMPGAVVFARVTRTLVQSLKTSLFVEAAELNGSTPRRVMRVHLLPNLYSPLITLCVLEFAAAILSESAFSFIGFGVQPPGASWGLMIAQGRTYITTGWWIVTFAGCAIAIAVLGANLIALWLQSFGDVSERESAILEIPGP